MSRRSGTVRTDPAFYRSRRLRRATVRPLRLAAAMVLLGAALSAPHAAVADGTGHPPGATDSNRAVDGARVRNGVIAFNLDPGTGAQIKAIRPNGTHLHTLVLDRHAAAESPAWSPRGHRLLYTRATDTGCHIIVAHSDGTHRRNLTRHHRGCESSPTFSPSGKRIIFVVQSCESCRTWIAGMDRLGRHRHRILAVPAGTSPEDVVVSPSGRRIAFEASMDADVKPFHRALLVARRDGTHLRTLVPYRFDAGVHFDWSSTGRWLVYTRWSENPPGHESNVVLISPDGSRQRQLTQVHRVGRAAGGATFSPDGQQIVYRFANLESQRFWLSTMDLDGTHNMRIRQLTTAPQGTAWAPRPR